jgi:acetyltransferase-like isoleucine patch superfamily enzyme
LPSDIKSRIVIEDDVLLGPNVSIYSSTHNFEDITQPVKEQGYNVSGVLLKKGCWVGVNSVILPGVTIGQNSVIGANSVVTKDVPDFSIAVGSPAKVIRNLNEDKK